MLEATAPDEVAGVLDAAEGAAARGLVGRGVRRLRGGARPRPGARGCERASPAIRSRASRSRGSRCSSDARTTVLPEPQRDRATSGDRIAGVPRSTGRRYDAAIAPIREHIAAGDTYQVNHTLRLRSQVEGDERGLYRDLCYAQRGAYAAYLNLGRYRVLSASPELFFRIDDGAHHDQAR